MRFLKDIIDRRIIRHFRETHAPVHELALASLVGIFWALTPLVGVQMSLVTGHWVLMRLMRLRFNLPIGIAWVWITNPITMPFFYYGFYLVGVLSYKVLGIQIDWVSFDSIKQALRQAEAMTAWEGLRFWMGYMVGTLGLPMLIGGFVTGIPCALAGYPITRSLVNAYRTKQAAKLGMTLYEWEARFVYRIEMPPLIVESRVGAEGAQENG